MVLLLCIEVQVVFSAKDGCISCNISVCNIFSAATNVDSDGYDKQAKKNGKFSSCAF